MRSIKFRAWDKEESKFINIKSFGFLEDGEVWYVQAIDESERELDPPYFTGEDDLVIIQNTGLHDKNGKEVYEGDIVKHRYHDEPQEILWDERILGYKLLPSESVLQKVDEDRGLFEIIGNRFEHPHLLEESK